MKKEINSLGDKNVVDKLLNRKMVENEVVLYQHTKVVSKKEKKKKEPWWDRPSTYIGLGSVIFFCVIAIFILVYLGKIGVVPFPLASHIIFGLFILGLLDGWLLFIAVALNICYD